MVKKKGPNVIQKRGNELCIMRNVSFVRKLPTPRDKELDRKDPTRRTNDKCQAKSSESRPSRECRLPNRFQDFVLG